MAKTQTCEFTVDFIPLSVTCPGDITDQNPRNPIVVGDYSAKPCGTMCTYKIFDESGNEKTFNGTSFSDPDGVNTKEYKLEAKNSGDEVESCTFKVTFKKVKSKCIPFVNGVYGYTENCYSSGLQNHAEGKCYALQDGRAQDQNAATIQWINEDANNTYWWKEVSCF